MKVLERNEPEVGGIVGRIGAAIEEKRMLAQVAPGSQEAGQR